MTSAGEHQPHDPKSEVEEWKAQGACAEHDPEVFFPERGADVDTAKRICAGCTVRRDCLTYALTPPVERFGIWGGMSNRERRKLTVAMIEGRSLPPIAYTAEARTAALVKANEIRNGGRFVARAEAAPPAPKAAKVITRNPRPINHGTDGGYRAHLRRGDKACESCLEAHRIQVNDSAARRLVGAS